MEDIDDQAKCHGQVQIHFSTELIDLELAEDKRQVLVPARKTNKHRRREKKGFITKNSL